MYKLEVKKHVDKIFEKIAKKDSLHEKAVKNKIRQILENPFTFKPLRKPLQNKRRVHILKSFVLVYSIKGKTVVLEDYAHHDKIYK